MKMCIVGMDHNLQSGPPNVIFVGLEPHLTIVVTTINPTAIVNQLGGINIASNFGPGVRGHLPLVWSWECAITSRDLTIDGDPCCRNCTKDFLQAADYRFLKIGTEKTSGDVVWYDTPIFVWSDLSPWKMGMIWPATMPTVVTTSHTKDSRKARSWRVGSVLRQWQLMAININ